MTVTAFNRGHLARMVIKAGTAREAVSIPGFVETLEHIGAKTILSADGKKVLGVMGAMPSLPGVCEVFILASEDQENYPVTFARIVKKELYTLKDKYRRIQAVSDNDNFHNRWLSWLGFQREGVMKKYGLRGEDMVMWGFI